MSAPTSTEGSTLPVMPQMAEELGMSRDGAMAAPPSTDPDRCMKGDQHNVVPRTDTAMQMPTDSRNVTGYYSDNGEGLAKRPSGDATSHEQNSNATTVVFGKGFAKRPNADSTASNQTGEKSLISELSRDVSPICLNPKRFKSTIHATGSAHTRTEPRLPRQKSESERGNGQCANVYLKRVRPSPSPFKPNLNVESEDAAISRFIKHRKLNPSPQGESATTASPVNTFETPASRCSNHPQIMNTLPLNSAADQFRRMCKGREKVGAPNVGRSTIPLPVRAKVPRSATSNDVAIARLLANDT